VPIAKALLAKAGGGQPWQHGKPHHDAISAYLRDPRTLRTLFYQREALVRILSSSEEAATEEEDQAAMDVAHKYIAAHLAAVLTLVGPSRPPVLLHVPDT